MADPHTTASSDDLAFALHLADIADSFTSTRYQSSDLHVETKPDLTPVTDADRRAEQLLRAEVQRARPTDAVVGEEFGGAAGAGRRWIFDPIDGTKNFVRGVPIWATLIALMDGDEVIVGVASAPELRRRWWAARGHGAWTQVDDNDPVRCRVSGVQSLSDASLSFSSLSSWPEVDRLLSLESRVWRSRAYGDFWSHMLVAEGAVDIAAEAVVALWDLAAPSIIVEEAGGTFTNLAGVRGPSGGSAVASNGLLHAQTLAALGTGASQGNDVGI
jgi:histidinol-phosphatase